MPWIIILLLLPVAVIVLIGWSLSAPRYKGPVSAHFDGRKFINPGNVKAKGLPDVLKWLMNRKKGEWSKITSHPVLPPPDRVEQGELLVTFVNHCTFLIQVDGVNILTDPIWSERASPFTWIGPRRMRPPGISLEALPPIDLVLLSHNHYDHLDIKTLKQLNGKHSLKIFTSLGIGSYLAKHGIHNFFEMDWGEELQFNKSISVASVPAQHFSGRGMFDRDATLWSGFIIRSAHGNIYFAADTGHNDFVKDEVKRFSPLRLAILPIGAYRPEWFMQAVHASPEESLKMHLYINAQTSIGSHFGTFPLADEGMNDPAKDLARALERTNTPPSTFIVPKEGEGIFIDPLKRGSGG